MHEGMIGQWVRGNTFIPIIFGVILLFFLVYYSAFEYTRYKAARLLGKGLGGQAVFRMGRSYMQRDDGGVEERAWIAPDDKMAWGSILSVLMPPAGVLFLRRGDDPGFRFHVEPKAGMLYRTVLLNGLKDTEFNVPQLDERLRLRTDDPAGAALYFSAPERRQALAELFLVGFSLVKGGRGGIVATMKGVSAENLGPERIDLYFTHLRSL